MGLFQELRKYGFNDLPSHQFKRKLYTPVFLKIIERKGKYVMSAKSLVAEMDTCLNKEKIPFNEWLINNNLNIRETESGNFIISK